MKEVKPEKARNDESSDSESEPEVVELKKNLSKITIKKEQKFNKIKATKEYEFDYKNMSKFIELEENTRYHFKIVGTNDKGKFGKEYYIKFDEIPDSIFKTPASFLKTYKDGIEILETENKRKNGSIEWINYSLIEKA